MTEPVTGDLPGSAQPSRFPLRVIPWMNRMASRLRARAASQHSVLFVIPGATGGFSRRNVDLYRDSPSFRESIDATAAVIDDMLGCDAVAAFRGVTESASDVETVRRYELVHLGMVRIALIDQWRAEGITPDGALGVSLGEVIAPYAVGAITREECARLVAVVVHSVTAPRTAQRVFVIRVDGESARRLCRDAPVIVDFLGAASPTDSLVIGSDGDREAMQSYFGDAVVMTAASGWRYHTPDMHFDRAWVGTQVGSGIAPAGVARPVYSPAAGGLLPHDVHFDARTLHWIMGSPSHFEEAVSAAMRDGFDVAVQLATAPMRFFADVAKTAQGAQRTVLQVESIDPKAFARVLAMRRRPVPSWSPAPPAMPELDAAWWNDVQRQPLDRESVRLCERLLQPLVDGKPLDVIALADRLADPSECERDELRNLLASSVLALLQNDRLRSRVVAQLEGVEGEGGTAAGSPRTRALAIVALRTMLRVAPDFAVLQPLSTVHRVNGTIGQLVISR